MKAQLPHPEHYSYKVHRKQMVMQIILPVALAGFLLAGMIVLISLATFKSGGDVGRWAAISTMWIVIPVMMAGLISLAILGGLIYLLARLLGILPAYTGLAQDYVYLARTYILRGADMLANQVIAIDGFIGKIKAIFGRN